MNTTVTNLRKQITASQMHTDRSHATAVMIYVLLTFFALFILTVVLGLVGYLLQRLRRVHTKRSCSRQLILATRNALKKIPLRTLRPCDKEVNSGCDQCAVCIEVYKASDVIRILPCRHFYHKKCIDPWLLEQRSCPLCKLDILKSCGILIGLSADDENYLATRLVERDSDSLSSSSSSISVLSYPIGWRIKRFVNSIIGKPHTSHSKCDACSLAYIQAMQLNALPIDDDSIQTTPPLKDNSWPTHIGTPRNVPLTWIRTHPERTRRACQFDAPPNTAVSLLSWICSCLCWWCVNLNFSNKTIFDSHPCHHQNTAYHVTKPGFDLESSHALDAARHLCLRKSNSTDQLCFYHASMMGLKSNNTSCVPCMVHWTQYANHCAALRQHLHNSRACYESPLSDPHFTWRQRFGMKPLSSFTNPSITKLMDCKHRVPYVGSKITATPLTGSNQTYPSISTTARYLFAEKLNSCTPSTDVLMPDKTEQTVVIHHVAKENVAITDSNSDGCIKSDGVDTNTDVDSRIQYPLDATTKLHEYQALSVLPPNYGAETQSSLSSDGSSDPSLVVLPSTSARGCFNPPGTFWSQSHDPTIHATPPTYLECVSQSMNSTVDADSEVYSRPQVKIRSRKFRNGYHPYIFSGTNRRLPIHVHYESEDNHSSSLHGVSDKVPRNSPLGMSFTTSVVRNENLVGRLARLFCFCSPLKLSPAPSNRSFAPQIQSVMSPSVNRVVNAAPNHFKATSILHDPTISTQTARSTLLQHQTASSLPQENITCPLCRLESREAAQHLHVHSQFNPMWRRMFQVHPFKRHGNDSLMFAHLSRSTGKAPHPRRKTPTCLRTTVHVHSYELQSLQSHQVRVGISDDLQTVISDSNNVNVETTTMMSAGLRGVRVTVEPPEVQYHNGPLTSDSSSSPVDSYNAEDCSPSSHVSHSSTHLPQHEIALDS